MRRWSLCVVLILGACDGEGDPDASVADAGSTDAGVTDASPMDAGSTDAGPSDAATDAGAADLDALMDAWCPDFAARHCAAAATCGCSPVPGFGDDAACRERAERGCRTQLERFRGDPRIEPAAAVPASCGPALEAALADCRMPEPELFAVTCPLIWPRDLDRDLPGAGSPCVDGLCAEGARCSSMGTCATPAAGAMCGSVGDCPDGDRCGDDARCRALDLTDSGTSCRGPADCTGDVTCLAMTRRECRAKTPGGPCTGDEACVMGEYCALDTCTPSPGLGLACGNGSACAAGLACRFAPGPGEGTCQALPMMDDPCALGPLGPFICAAGLACRDRLCGAIPGDGDTCAVGDVRCADGLGCHFVGADSLCLPRVGEGEACGLDDSCAAGLFCDFGTGRCAAVLATGEICTDGNECGVDGACVPDETATTFRCVPRPGLGGQCFFDSDCLGDLTCRSPLEAGLCAPPVCSAFVF